MKVLVITTMFPNPAQPVHAVFVHRRLTHVAKLVSLEILAPIPWFPFGTLLPRYAIRREIPREATIGTLTAKYPRFLSIPRLWKPLDGIFLFLCVWWHTRGRRNEFDLVDAHLAFPDGFAAYLLAKLWKCPFTVTLRGHDVNHLPQHRVRRRMIMATLRNAARVVSVAEALRREAITLGTSPDHSRTIANGVDQQLFRPEDQMECRLRLGLPLDARIIVSVGHLVERKGQHLVLEALQALAARGIKNLFYVIIGGPGEEGNFLPEISRRIQKFGLKNSVMLAGARRNEELRAWYSAADFSCLASSKEGWANVLLESLACGTPVIATRVWGTPEVLCSPDYGVLVERTPDSIAAGIEEALGRTWSRARMVSYAHSFSWDDVAKKVVEDYHHAIER